jgi:large subunit ribosomal protein L9
MKVILTQDVKGQGKKGDLINVSYGYARNFLLPKNLAKEANKQALTELESQKGAQQYHKNQEELKANNMKDQLKTVTVNLKAKAGADGRLFGSITTKDIAEGLEKQHKINVDKRKIDLPGGIKNLGETEVKISLYPGISGTFKVNVTEE